MSKKYKKVKRKLFRYIVTYVSGYKHTTGWSPNQGVDLSHLKMPIGIRGIVKIKEQKRTETLYERTE